MTRAEPKTKIVPKPAGIPMSSNFAAENVALAMRLMTCRSTSACCEDGEQRQGNHVVELLGYSHHVTQRHAELAAQPRSRYIT
jgi:hypothetical protein